MVRDVWEQYRKHRTDYLETIRRVPGGRRQRAFAAVLLLGAFALLVIAFAVPGALPLGGFAAGLSGLASLVIARLNNKVHRYQSTQ